MSRETCVRYYTTGTATVAVHFPNGLTVCQWCSYIQYRDGLKRHQCALTGEFLLVFPQAAVQSMQMGLEMAPRGKISLEIEKIKPTGREEVKRIIEELGGE